VPVFRRVLLVVAIDAVFVVFAVRGDLPVAALVVLLAAEAAAFALRRQPHAWLIHALVQGVVFGLVLELFDVVVDNDAFVTRDAVFAGSLFAVVAAVAEWLDRPMVVGR
jgi:hypothetical protein